MLASEKQLRFDEPEFEEPSLTLEEAIYVRVIALQLGCEGGGSPDDHTYLWHDGAKYLVVVLQPGRYAVYEMEKDTPAWGGESPVCTLDLDLFKPSAYCRWLTTMYGRDGVRGDNA